MYTLCKFSRFGPPSKKYIFFPKYVTESQECNPVKDVLRGHNMRY